MTHENAPIHSPQKLLESINVQYLILLHIHYFCHTCTNPSLSKLFKSTICSLPIKSFIFLSMPIKYRAYYYLIHPFINIYIIAKLRLLRHLFYNVHINTTQNQALPTTQPPVHTIHISTIQHTHLPPIIHNILSINLHMSTHHTIKTYHNPQTS